MFATALGFDFDLPDWPGYVWLLLIVAALAWAWKLGLVDKLRKIKSPVAKKTSKNSYGTIPDSLLPPGVIEMKKSIATMKKQRDEAIATETRRTVEEYTSLIALTASQTASLPLP